MKTQEGIFWVITLFLLGAIGVLIIKNPTGASTAFGAIFGGFNSWATTLTGSGYSGGTGTRRRRG